MQALQGELEVADTERQQMVTIHIQGLTDLVKMQKQRLEGLNKEFESRAKVTMSSFPCATICHTQL